jgi:hypothetical protein
MLRSLQIKHLALLLFLALFFTGRAADLTAPRLEADKKIKQTEHFNKFIKENQNEIPAMKRRYRAKGTQVALVQISNLTFIEVSVYNDFSPAILKNICSSFSNYAHQKRGPPAPHASMVYFK